MHWTWDMSERREQVNKWEDLRCSPWFIVNHQLCTDHHSHPLAQCLREDWMETLLWSISASHSLMHIKEQLDHWHIRFCLRSDYYQVLLLTQCEIWAGSGVWAAVLHTVAGGRWSLRFPAASDWDPSLSALLSWHERTPWTSMYCERQ